MYCTHCGKQIANDSKFCTFCGSLLYDEDFDDDEVQVIENLVVPKINIDCITLPESNSLRFKKYDPIFVDLFYDVQAELPSEFVHYKNIKDELSSIKLISFVLNQFGASLNATHYHDFDSFFNTTVFDVLKQPYYFMASICCYYFAAYGITNTSFQTIYSSIMNECTELSEYLDIFGQGFDEVYDANYTAAVNRANTFSGIPFFGIGGLIACEAINAHNENMIRNVSLTPQQKQYFYSMLKLSDIINMVHCDIEKIHNVLARDLFAKGVNICYFDNTLVEFINSNLTFLKEGVFPEEERKYILRDLFVRMPYNDDVIDAIIEERKKDGRDYSDPKYDLSKYKDE